MTYNFSQRLQHAGTRFEQLNPETVTYVRGDEEFDLIVNPVLDETQEVSAGPAVTKVEIQRFAYNLSDVLLDDPLPALDDYIIRANGTVYKPGGRPHFRYVTNLRTRIILTATLVQEGI